MPLRDEGAAAAEARTPPAGARRASRPRRPLRGRTCFIFCLLTATLTVSSTSGEAPGDADGLRSAERPGFRWTWATAIASPAPGPDREGAPTWGAPAVGWWPVAAAHPAPRGEALCAPRDTGPPQEPPPHPPHPDRLAEAVPTCAERGREVPATHGPRHAGDVGAALQEMGGTWLRPSMRDGGDPAEAERGTAGLPHSRAALHSALCTQSQRETLLGSSEICFYHCSLTNHVIFQETKSPLHSFAL